MKKFLFIILSSFLFCISILEYGTYIADAESNVKIVNVDPGIETITEGQAKELITTGYEQIHRLAFVPNETGIYKYYSSNMGDVFGKVYDDKETLIGLSNNWQYQYGYNKVTGPFEIKINLIAGETYYLESYMPNDNKGTYSVRIDKLDEASNISFGGRETVDCYINDYKNLYLYYTPSNSRTSEVKFTSTNPDVVTVSKSFDTNDDVYAKVFGNAFGNSTITVTTYCGLTDTIVVNVVDYPDIKLDVEQSDGSLNGIYYYRFVPEEDGIYKVSVGSNHNMFNTYVEIYDANFRKIVNTSYEATISCELKAGEKYYYKVNPVTDDILDTVYTLVTKVSDEDLSSTEVMPTVAPTATPEPLITETPEPTATPESTVTPTPEPNITPTSTCIYPTDTPEPVLTPTPEPTVTAAMVPTEIPTIMPQETDTFMPTETLMGYALGNVDNNNMINAEDALLVLKHAAKINSLVDSQMLVADITQDGNIDALDALEILKIAAKI